MLRSSNKRLLNWFFTMGKFIHQTIEFNVYEFYARTLSQAVSEPFCVWRRLPETIEQHPKMMTCSTEYKKNKMGLINYRIINVIYLIVHSVATFSRRCAHYSKNILLKTAWWLFPYTARYTVTECRVSCNKDRESGNRDKCIPVPQRTVDNSYKLHYLWTRVVHLALITWSLCYSHNVQRRRGL